MNVRDTNRFTMLLAVQQYLDNHTATWSTIPILTTLKNEYDALITEIKADLQRAGDELSGVTVSKNMLKDQVATRTVRYAGGLKAYAKVNGNEELAAKADVSHSYFLRHRDADFPQAVQNLLDLLNAEVLNLADYGITEAQLTELGTSLDDFREMIGAPREQQSAADIANREATEGVRDAVDLLNNRMDAVMLMFEGTDPGFYRGYESARVIVD